MAPNDVLYDNTMSASARHLYNILLSFAWRKNTAYPGQKLLAEIMRVDERTIRTYLSELEEKGLVSKQHRGLTKTNLYTLHEWISPTQERKNNLVSGDSNHPPQNGGQLPTNNTKYKKTKGEERVGTHSQPPTTFSDGSQNMMVTTSEIIDNCMPHLRDISLTTGVTTDDVNDVLVKMANHYVAEGKTFSDWKAKLVTWVINDLQAEKISKDFDVIRRAEREKTEVLRQKNRQTMVSVFGEGWSEIPGLRDKANAYLKEHGYIVNQEELRYYLEELKESGFYDEVSEEVDEYAIISLPPDRS